MPDKKRILATRRFPAAVEARLARDYAGVLNAGDRLYDADALVRAARGMDGVFATATESFPAGVVERLPDSVRILATMSVGTDHIDLAAARARGLVVTYTPDVLSEACADIAMLLLLAAARRAYEGDRLVRSGEWRGWAPTQLLGRELNGHRLGILGMGRIGRALARRARGFGLEVHYHNRRRLEPAREDGARYHAEADSLLAVSEFLSLNCPATEATRGVLDAARIARLPQGAVVVNISRGDLVVDDALIAALESGRLAGAGLDVFAGEPDVDPRYRRLDNVFLLPHLGSATVETRTAMGNLVLDSFDAFFAGAEVPHRVA
jgi:lactate dehydrogenase-like 2-hydroxyacid dehydrogenase